MLTIDQFDYHLPPERIAHQPLAERDQSRLLVVNRASGELEHRHFYDLPELLAPNTVIVRNNTKVIPARLFGQKETGGQVELLLTRRLTQSANGETWECLTRPGLKPGQRVSFEGSQLTAECRAITDYSRKIFFNLHGHALFSELEKIGRTPIPPYIPAWDEADEPQLRQVYQTTYAKIKGSAAAPTAGLHFTPEIEKKLAAKGVKILEVTLHVGLGTFLRVKTKNITDHQMHHEWFELSLEVADQINQAKQNGAPILSVGTTTTRVLETCAQADGTVSAQSGETNIFLYPPYHFKVVDQQITNFHEPQSTLLMLVSAFVSAPNTQAEFSTFKNSLVGQAYQAAIDSNYRMLSFGDAMLIR